MQPALAVIGAKSIDLDPIWLERQELLLAWLQNVEPFVLPDAGHLLQVENPGGMAAGLAAFLGRHALRAPHGPAAVPGMPRQGGIA
jgi:pimeloyl-ACP methyl ester carboxylesterase